MPNDDHIALLKKGVTAWNAWRDGNDVFRPNLSGADLSRADLSGANLSGANLRLANLSKANLYEANLGGADASIEIGVLERSCPSSAPMRRAVCQGLAARKGLLKISYQISYVLDAY
jgi:uncharacterized protein YjbI with pentapeptide repeats